MSLWRRNSRIDIYALLFLKFINHQNYNIERMSVKKMKNILVTGALGTVGIFSINKLLAETNYNIIGIDDYSANSPERINNINNNKNFNFYNNSTYSIDKIFEENSIDTILHLASLTSVSESMNIPISYVNDNITFTTELLEKAKKYKTKRFVFASSSTVYGKNSRLYNEETDLLAPISVYAITKKTCEDLINLYNQFFGIETIILRYYNNFAKIKYYRYKTLIPLIFDKINNNECITLFNNGRQKRQFVPIENIAYANKLAIETEDPRCIGQAFNITVDEEPISLLSLIDYISSKLDKEIKYKLDPTASIGDVEIASGSNKKAKKLLNFKIQKNMYDGIDEYIEWFKNNRQYN